MTQFNFCNAHRPRTVSPGCPVSESPAVDYGQFEISGFHSSRSPATLSENYFIICFNLTVKTQTYCTFPPLLSALIFLPTVSTTTDKPSYTSASEKEDRFHVNARQFYYPDSKVTRFPVPEEKVPWQVFHHSKEFDHNPGYFLRLTSWTARRPVAGELHRICPNKLLRKGRGHPGRVGHCVVG